LCEIWLENPLKSGNTGAVYWRLNSAVVYCFPLSVVSSSYGTIYSQDKYRFCPESSEL